MKAVGSNENERIVLEFFDSWESSDVDRVLSYFAEEGNFTNAANPGMPLPVRRGHAEIRGYLELLFETREVRIETLRIGSNDDGVVFTERIDWVRARGEGGDWAALPIAGVLEVRDGKVSEWREYLDTRTLEDQLDITIERQEV
ncbi:MAG: nuclear transport factor 2 family protein [Actinobacteria bacterium]|nr:nuclear transport factor 2 family protein [Actinomycetota bacterium]